MRKRPKCKFCGRRAVNSIENGRNRFYVCAACSKQFAKGANEHGFTDLGGGVFAPPDALLLTCATYGSLTHLEYVSAAVHRGSEVIEAVVHATKDISPDAAAEEAIALAKKYNVKLILQLSEPVPVEFAECGHLAIRIADGKGNTIPTYKPFENN